MMLRVSNKKVHPMVRIALAAVCVTTVWLLSSCSQPEKAAQPAQTKKKPPLVAVAAVHKGSVARTIRLPGTIRPDIVANVLSPAEGKITSLDLREGDYVRRDAVIGKISPAMREDILNAARLKSGTDKSLEFARKQYREIAIVAPINGVVAIRSAETGDMVVQRQKLLEIQSPTRLHVEVVVPEREITFIEKGMRVQITLDALTGETFSGKVTRIYPRLEEKTRTGTVEVSIPHEISGKLKVGMFARISFELQRVDDALLVPSEAIILTPAGTPAVYIVRDKKAELFPVTIGLESDGTVEITGDISAGDAVVTAGNESLKSGAAVRLPKAGEKNAQNKESEAAK